MVGLPFGPLWTKVNGADSELHDAVSSRRRQLPQIALEVEANQNAAGTA